MSFALSSKSPRSVNTAIAAAIKSRQDADEATMITVDGTGKPGFKTEFAGDRFFGKTGLNGEFASFINDPQGYEQTASWSQLYNEGQFSPFSEVPEQTAPASDTA